MFATWRVVIGWSKVLAVILSTNVSGLMQATEHGKTLLSSKIKTLSDVQDLGPIGNELVGLVWLLLELYPAEQE